MSDPIRILVVDDHALFRTTLARSLGAEPDFLVAGECGTVQEGLAVIKDSPVDLVLLDINLGAEQGGSFLNSIRSSGFRGKVLVVTAGVSEREASWLLKHGCAGIFLKTEPLNTLFNSVREIVRDGATYKTSPGVTSTPEANVRRPLSARESRVLRYVCEGLSNKEIAGRMEVSESNIKSHLQQLFSKTGARSRAQLVSLAIEDYWDQLDTSSKK